MVSLVNREGESTAQSQLVESDRLHAKFRFRMTVIGLQDVAPPNPKNE